MFDIGGWEFMIIVVLGIIIIGPKELPGAIRNVTMWIRKARGLAREFQGGLDDMVREVELDKVKEEIQGKLDPTDTMSSLRAEIEEAVDPEGEIAGSFDIEGNDWYSDHHDDEMDEAAEVEEHTIAPPEAIESAEADDGIEASAEAPTDTEEKPDSADAGTRA